MYKRGRRSLRRVTLLETHAQKKTMTNIALLLVLAHYVVAAPQPTSDSYGALVAADPIPLLPRQQDTPENTNKSRGAFPNSVPPGGVCSIDGDCSGYPFAYCSGTCMCRDGALNAGSTCVEQGRCSV